MKKLLLLCLYATILLCASASVVYDFNFEDFKQRDQGEYKSLSLMNGQTWGNPGEPELPWIGVKLLLPLNHEASEILVHRSNPVSITLDKHIQPIQQQYPFSLDQRMPDTEPDYRIYSADAIFPLRPDNGLRTEFLAGHPIAFSAICPFDYNPMRSELTFYRNVSIEIRTQVSQRAINATSLLKQEAFITRFLSRSVDNQNAVPRYTERTEGTEYIIVIDAAKYNQWLPLKIFYEGKGYAIEMKTIQDITAQYTGVDTQDKIRNFFIDMYTNNSLRYALLAGDTDVIPHRGLYVNFSQGGQTDADIPADMYYSCLDGNWNNNGNSYWGEIYEADLAPEFAIGRFCYNSDSEIADFINKVMLYQIAPVESTLKSSAFVGEYLWAGPTWGGDYMDEMIGGSSMNGYTTVGVPTSWNTPTLYDRTYGYENGWGGTQIRALLSAGHNLVNHLGHSATRYNMRLNYNGVSNSTITNDGSSQNYSIYFSQGCYAGAFDNRDTSVGSYVGDCIAERFTSISNAAVGMIAHSRYGWGMQGSTNGASQYFHRQYIDAIFGENIHDLGYTLVDSKIDNIPFISNSPVMYWVTYETNLLGDPAMMIWTDTPQAVSAQLPSIWNLGVNSYQIQTNAPNASVRLNRDGQIVYETTANANGLININLLQPLLPGMHSLHINAVNFYPYQANVNVEITDMPYVVCNAIEVTGSDGLIQSGELISLSFDLQNVGTMGYTGTGTLVLSSNSPHVNILQNSYSFNPINAGESLTVPNAFQMQIGTSFTDGTPLPLTITASYGTYSTQSNITLSLNAPTLSVTSYQVVNNASLILPGHSPQISFTVNNSGSGYAYMPIILIMDSPDGVTVSDFEISLPVLEPNSTIDIPLAFSVSIGAEVEVGSTITIPYFLMGENGSGYEGSFSFHIGIMSYTFENDLQNWTSETLNTQFVNQWHRSSARNYTPDGSFSVKFGGTGTGQYANSAFGAMVSPELILGINSQLKFYHWIDAETHTTTGMAWDGGMVELSINNGEWTQISPVGGYPYRIYNNAASPFAANTWVYSGTQGWQEAIFDLSSYSGTARVRFVFGTDGAVTGEGWYIDDIRLESDYVEIDDLLSSPQSLSLSNYPNPFNPTTTISFYLPENGSVSLDIFNIKGQRVKSLASKRDFNTGKHSIIWDGKDEKGNSAASGVYFYRLQTSSSSLTNKMLMMK